MLALEGKGTIGIFLCSCTKHWSLVASVLLNRAVEQVFAITFYSLSLWTSWYHWQLSCLSMFRLGSTLQWHIRLFVFCPHLGPGSWIVNESCSEAGPHCLEDMPLLHVCLPQSFVPLSCILLATKSLLELLSSLMTYSISDFARCASCISDTLKSV